MSQVTATLTAMFLLSQQSDLGCLPPGDYKQNRALIHVSFSKQICTEHPLPAISEDHLNKRGSLYLLASEELASLLICRLRVVQSSISPKAEPLGLG